MIYSRAFEGKEKGGGGALSDYNFAVAIVIVLNDAIGSFSHKF